MLLLDNNGLSKMVEKDLSQLCKSTLTPNLSHSSDEDSVIESSKEEELCANSSSKSITALATQQQPSLEQAAKLSPNESQNDLPRHHTTTSYEAPAVGGIKRPADSTLEENSSNKIIAKVQPSIRPTDAIIHLPHCDERTEKRLIDFDLTSTILRNGSVPKTVFEEYLRLLVPEYFVMHVTLSNSYFLWNV
jgi:hypothetical protein